MERMMKKSDNFHAEALFYQIAASTGKPLCKASDDVLRYKLIYFVLQRMMFWRPADDVLLPPIGSNASDEWK